MESQKFFNKESSDNMDDKSKVMQNGSKKRLYKRIPDIGICNFYRWFSNWDASNRNNTYRNRLYDIGIYFLHSWIYNRNGDNRFGASDAEVK